ncbi:1-deoxy-D-xylulose-5-phosphate synthase [Paucidesulfovibrio gracilis DSM 16080]|uniref:1-deoxy-D-xylulose-5-phosphate synthase n=1 Tax=Paucidesulfovibrio gracilis DSM 16080 TaxID=1121449 RepID=A0A1T4W4D5_9BACT|nr:1-deoxy-D-xylulose-5-phosphate synthase [Paucidesulfovibrio gracilis]SKA72116.1 1-deoxy-D-xylulose-5-phosphate synthase [Paucidesulfovibrio gracilis DSM 16080]
MNIPQELELLPKIKGPADVRACSVKELETMAAEIRQVIISQVSQTGGHLAPNLGTVELTLALFRAFDLDQDKLIWDVGHQAYTHKLLTGRLNRFDTLRQFGGVSGFPRMAESPYDHFGVGHSSTSISAGLGIATARDLKEEDFNVVSVIGDGSLTGGLAFEGLNQAGDLERPFIVVLNDNEMSISTNVGALSRFLSRTVSAPMFVRWKDFVERRIKDIPGIGDELHHWAKRGKDSFKSFFTPGMLFEAFRFNYVGPLDGHDIGALADTFEQVKRIDTPVLVHVMTKKGKGYKPAETNPTYFHGVGRFEPETGLAPKPTPGGWASYTEVFGATLCTLAQRDEKIVAITAAMPEGTGTDCFRTRFPERFHDVGICEQHAVTFAAGLATQGYKPAVSIYSTFLQRSYDQIIHDVCLQNLNVNFFLDRGGLVGEDGATHHGAFDLSFLRLIPNMTLMAPKDEDELARMMATAFAVDGPTAVRYPRGMGVGVAVDPRLQPLQVGTGELERSGSDGAIIAIGSRVLPAMEAAEELSREQGLELAVFNARFVKPLPKEQLLALAAEHKCLIIVEENAIMGGFSSAVLELLADNGAMDGLRVHRMGLPDAFVEHGTQKELRTLLGIDKQGIKQRVLDVMR